MDFSARALQNTKNRPKAVFCILSFAPAAGFEPATNALHVIPYFRKGTDYIFTIPFRD